VTLPAQRAALYRTLAAALDLSAEQRAAVAAIIDASPYIGQGNPAISRHPMTRAECRAIRADAGAADGPHPPCRRVNMVPIYDPGAGETAADARVCIDQFEFPDIPCEYPLVYASAREAALLCVAVGKRLCDAHEWEGACAGALRPPEVDYAFGKPRPYATWLHNKAREVRWAHGPTKDDARCGTGGTKTPGCPGGGFTQCGTNSYPAGAFPGCVSPFGVYDQHGNVAEHLNLPLSPEELTGRGGTGQTEMKGSWFAFQSVLDPHEDDCRWRAKDWHPSRLMDVESHRNYHLGLRCCAAP
jgi:formylglycine-generating enzyme required for sulfatase activity